MKAVIQRVTNATLRVDGERISEIGAGLVVFLGIAPQDTEETAGVMARKIVNMRIFSDANGKMNLSVLSTGGSILLVSQFTLFGDCAHGNRPSFTGAAAPDRADALYRKTAEKIAEHGVCVRLGVFGADMKIEQNNDGPVTIVYEC